MSAQHQQQQQQRLHWLEIPPSLDFSWPDENADVARGSLAHLAAKRLCAAAGISSAQMSESNDEDDDSVGVYELPRPIPWWSRPKYLLMTARRHDDGCMERPYFRDDFYTDQWMAARGYGPLGEYCRACCVVGESAGKITMYLFDPDRTRLASHYIWVADMFSPLMDSDDDE